MANVSRTAGPTGRDLLMEPEEKLLRAIWGKPWETPEYTSGGIEFSSDITRADMRVDQLDERGLFVLCYKPNPRSAVLEFMESFYDD